MARRVFLGLNEVAGYLTHLEAGLVELGVDARLHDLSGNPLGYGSARAGRAGVLRLSGASPGTWRRRAWNLILRIHRIGKVLRSVVLLPVALARYDAFILEGRDLFFNGRGLWLLRRFQKRVVVIFLGSDHRPPYLNGIWLNDARSRGYREIARDTIATAARVRRAERYADAVVALPTSAQFHVAPFIHLLAMGLPRPEGTREPAVVTPGSATIRVLHSPTNPEAKGSDRIRAAIERLRDKGIGIELQLLHGVPHAAVLRAIQSSDFIVDEVFSDSPMASFAAEAATYRRPAVIGSYAHDRFADLAALQLLPPTLFCHPDSIESAIERLATDVAFREDLGRQAQEFVHRAWTRRAVASRILRILDGDADPTWMVRPQDLSYVHGWGVSEDKLAKGVRAFVIRYGPSALKLDRRPDLRDALLELAGGS